MKVKLSTDLCPIIIPDTYGSNFQNELNNEENSFERLKEIMITKAKEYIIYYLKETDFKDAVVVMGNFKSPRFYNYGTDWIEFSLEFDYELIQVIKENVNDDFFKYVKSSFGSYSGYVSFYPYKKDKFYECLESNTKLEYIVSMYIMWQIAKDNYIENVHNDYLEDVYDYANSNTDIFDWEEFDCEE